MPTYEQAIKDPDIVGLEEVSPHPNFLVFGESGSGKGHPYGTRILSPKGWIKIEDLQAGSVIVGFDGKPQQVTGVYDRGKLDAYWVEFHDGSRVIVDGDHLWQVLDVNHAKRDGEKIVNTRWLMQRRLSGYSIPIVEPVEHSSSTKLGGYLMGVLLANGYFGSGTPVVTTNDQQVIENIFAEDSTVTIEEKAPSSAARRWSWRGGAFVLQQYGLWGLNSREKFIPSEFYWAPIETRKGLLAGLLDCDGTVRQSNGQSLYSTRSKYLAYGMRKLVESLGGIGLINCRNEIDYTVSLKVPFNPFRLDRKAALYDVKPLRQSLLRRRFESIEPAGQYEIRCISVSNEDQLYVTERHIVTHNTVLGGSDDRVLFISTEAEGCLSARRFGSTAKQVIIRHYDDIENFYEKAYAWSQTPTGIPFTWFVFDSITEAQNLLFEKILAEAGKIVEDWPEYRKNQKMLLRLVRRFNALPVNMLWLALDRKETDPDGEEFYCPEIHGKGYSIAMQVASQMTSYGYLQAKSEKVPLVRDGKPVMNPKTGKQRITLKTHRFIYWQDIQSIKGKDRTLELEPFTRDLTLKEIRLRVEKAFASETPNKNVGVTEKNEEN